MNIDTVCLLIAAEYHGGTLNKHDGSLYFLHPIRVAEAAHTLASAHGADPLVCKSIGYLHDTIEDTTLTEDELWSRLRKGGVPIVTAQSIVTGVMALTKIKGQTNEDYYNLVVQNLEARVVKICDITDNFRRNHLIVKDDVRERMMKKYSIGLDILNF